MKNYLMVFGSLTMVVLLIASSAPGAFNPDGPTGTDILGEIDPCMGTTDTLALLDRVCQNGKTITQAEGPVLSADPVTTHGVSYVSFTVLTPAPIGAPPSLDPLQGAVEDRRIVIALDDGGWSRHLPGGQDLRLRHADDVAAALGDTPTQGNDPYRIIGLTTPMLTAWHEALRAHDVSLHGYLPVNHHIVRLGDEADEEAILALPFVHTLTDFDPANKVEPGITTQEGELLIHALTMPGVGDALDKVEGRVLDLGGEVIDRIDPLNRLTIRIDADRIPQLALHPEVRWINPTSDVAETDMDIIRVRTGAEAAQTAPMGFDGTGVVGQVMDSGLQENHPDLEGSLLEVDGSSIVSFHGTAVYGVVFGDGTNNAAATGMAPGAKGTFAWYNSGMSRYTHASNLADRWDGVFQTHSWGRGIPKDNTYDSHSVEMDQIVDDLGVLALQSMSNCGPECARREAMAKNIVAVGALYHYDSLDLGNDVWAGGGSRASTGPASDGRIKPEMAGPYDRILTTSTNSGYTSGFGGTSGATPVNAGAVAIIHQMIQDGHFGPHPTGKGSPAAAKALLTASGHTYEPDQLTGPGPDKWALEPYRRDVQGWGAPQLNRLADAGEQVYLVDNENAVATGEASLHTYTVPEGTKELHVSLTWTDPPANPSGAVTIVNDLDLLVSGPAGVPLFWGNFGLNQFEHSLPGIPDRLNTIEKVIIPQEILLTNPVVTITVIGAAVQQDQNPGSTLIEQPYALAVVPVFE